MFKILTRSLTAATGLRESIHAEAHAAIAQAAATRRRSSIGTSSNATSSVSATPTALPLAHGLDTSASLATAHTVSSVAPTSLYFGSPISRARPTSVDFNVLEAMHQQTMADVADENSRLRFQVLNMAAELDELRTQLAIQDVRIDFEALRYERGQPIAPPQTEPTSIVPAAGASSSSSVLFDAVGSASDASVSTEATSEVAALLATIDAEREAHAATREAFEQEREAHEATRRALQAADAAVLDLASQTQAQTQARIVDQRRGQRAVAKLQNQLGSQSRHYRSKISDAQAVHSQVLRMERKERAQEVKAVEFWSAVHAEAREETLHRTHAEEIQDLATRTVGRADAADRLLSLACEGFSRLREESSAEIASLNEQLTAAQMPAAHNASGRKIFKFRRQAAAPPPATSSIRTPASSDPFNRKLGKMARMIRAGTLDTRVASGWLGPA